MAVADARVAVHVGVLADAFANRVLHRMMTTTDEVVWSAMATTSGVMFTRAQSSADNMTPG